MQLLNYLEKQNRSVHLIILFLFAFILNINTLSHDFAWDDKIVIQENSKVQKGLSDIPELFTKFQSDRLEDKYGYRPITLLSFALDFQLFGLNPAAFHFTQVLFYGLLAIVLCLFLSKLFPQNSNVLNIGIVAFFISHPLHSEVVANVKSRDELFALLFGILSLTQFLKYQDKSRLKHLLFGIALFLLAFLSKENAITFLAIIPLILIIRKIPKRNQLIVFGASLITITIVAILVLNYARESTAGSELTAGLGAYNESHILGNEFLLHNDTFGKKLANGVNLIAMYLKDFLIPHPLLYYHGSGSFPIRTWSNPIIIFTALFSFLIAIWSLLNIRKKPISSIGILFFFISLSPYLNIVLPLSDAMADRFLFSPSFGLCIAFLGLFVEVLKDKIKPKSSFYLAFVLILIFSILTIKRNAVWKNDDTLIESDIEYLLDSSRPNYHYATQLNLRMQEKGWNPNLEALMIKHYERSINLSDSAYYARLDLALYYHSNEFLDKAILLYKDMIRLYPKTSDPYFYLGKVYIQKNENKKAIPLLEAAIRHSENSFDSYYLLGLSLAREGRFEEAINHTEKSLKMFPGNGNDFNNVLSEIYYLKGDLELSSSYALERLKFNANAFEVYSMIIGRYQNSGNEEKAMEYYQEAIQKGIMKAQ